MSHCSQDHHQYSAQHDLLMRERSLESALENMLAQWLHHFKSNRLNRALFGRSLDALNQVIIKPLSDDDLVKIVDHHLYIDDAYIKSLAESQYTDEYRIQCGMLYAIHELIHCAHRIDKKPSVLSIRKVSEPLLMKFDLEADHYAALLLSDFSQEWSLLELKTIQVLCLEDFPVMKRHTEGARRRKALRLVSLRLECALRQRELLNEGEREHYVVVHLEGCQGVIILEGLISRVIETPEVSEEEGAFLLSVADQTTSDHYIARLGELDAWIDALICRYLMSA